MRVTDNQWQCKPLQPSPLNYGAWADQTDFKPEVRKACEAQKQSSKSPYVLFIDVQIDVGLH